MNTETEHRIATACEAIAGALVSIAKTLELDYSRRYPVKPSVRDADITFVPSEEERLREDQGGTGEKTVSDWTDIGRREQEWEDGESALARHTRPRDPSR